MKFSFACAGVVAAVICCWVRVVRVPISVRQGARAEQTEAAQTRGPDALEQATSDAHRTRRKTMSVGRAGRMGRRVRGRADSSAWSSDEGAPGVPPDAP